MDGWIFLHATPSMGELKAWDSATNSNVPLDKTGEDGLAPKQYRLPTNFAFGATETH